MNKLLLLAIFISIISSFVVISSTFAEETNAIAKHIIRFSKVDENLYRGGQPDTEGYKLLKEMGIKRVINFRYEKKLVEEERLQVMAHGMEYVHIPWAIFARYNNEVFEKFFDAIADRENTPVFFHCKRGSERTGVAAAAYEIKTHGTSVDTAFENAKKFDVKFIWAPFVKSAIKHFKKHDQNDS